MLLAALSSLAAMATCEFISAASLELPQREVRIADIVSLDCIEPRQRAQIAAAVVAVIPEAEREIRVSRRALAALVRRRIPALAHVALGAAPGDLRLLAPARAQAAHREPACVAVARPIAAGAALSLGDLVREPCRTTTDIAPLRFDRAHAIVRASEDLAEGAYLGQLLLPETHVIDRGQVAVLRVRMGTVTVDREIIAVQPVLGQRAAVRAENGEVFLAQTSLLVAREPDR